jgi:hypothetical protein
MTAVAALQAALAAEQQVVYGYGVAGALLSGAEQAYARQCVSVHEIRRDRITALLRSDGAAPVAAQPAYSLPFRVSDPSSARRLAGQLEAAGAGAAWDLVAAGATGSSARSLGIAWLADAAVRSTRWGRAVAPFPGQPD